MRFACWITKATDTHIHTICNTHCFSWQQWFRECATMVRYNTLILLSESETANPFENVYTLNRNVCPDMLVVPVEWPQAQAVFMLWKIKETVQNVIKTARNVFIKVRPPFQSRTAHGVTQKIIAKRHTGKVKVSFYRITEICRHSVASYLHPR